MPAPKQQWDDATLTSVTAGIETKCRKLSEARRTVRKVSLKTADTHLQ